MTSEFEVDWERMRETDAGAEVESCQLGSYGCARVEASALPKREEEDGDEDEDWEDEDWEDEDWEDEDWEDEEEFEEEEGEEGELPPDEECDENKEYDENEDW